MNRPETTVRVKPLRLNKQTVRNLTRTTEGHDPAMKGTSPPSACSCGFWTCK